MYIWYVAYHIRFGIMLTFLSARFQTWNTIGYLGKGSCCPMFLSDIVAFYGPDFWYVDAKYWGFLKPEKIKSSIPLIINDNV